MTAYELRISDWNSDVCSSDLSSACAPLSGFQMALEAGADMLSAGLHLDPFVRRGKTVAIAIGGGQHLIGQFAQPFRFERDDLDIASLGLRSGDGRIVIIGQATHDHHDYADNIGEVLQEITSPRNKDGASFRRCEALRQEIEIRVGVTNVTFEETGRKTQNEKE